MAEEGALPRPPLRHAQRRQQGPGRARRGLQDDRRRRQPSDGPDHQAPDRRRPRRPRRLAPRALRRPADVDRPQHGLHRGPEGDGQVRHRERLPGRDPRHRRPGQPRDARYLRGSLQGPPRQDRPALADRARPAPQPRRHPALRPARRHRGHAGHPLHLRRALGVQAARREAGRRGRLRLAQAHGLGRRRSRTARTCRSSPSTPWPASTPR